MRLDRLGILAPPRFGKVGDAFRQPMQSGVPIRGLTVGQTFQSLALLAQVDDVTHGRTPLSLVSSIAA
ncbi:MAG: hypothetical protein AAF899_20035 [Pseudomonadota bacterium]